MGPSNEPVDVDDIDDDSIDENQLKEYGESLSALESFPDKVTINVLSMVAEDYAERNSSSEKIYRVIRRRLLGCGSASYVLPVIYVLDSILKNAKGAFVQLVEDDAKNWIDIVHERLDGNQRQKLQKVWKMWNDCKVFDVEKWKAMGTCFTDPTVGLSSTTFPAVAGISRTKDGKLIMSSGLRKSMQSILDEMQEGTSNELDKVSLERLANIDANLFAKIKQAAVAEKSESRTPFANSQTDNRESDWSSANVDAEGVASSLRSIVASMHDDLYEKSDALQITELLAAANVAANWLDNTVSHVSAVSKQLDEQSKTKLTASGSAGLLINPADFTNEGVKKRSLAVVALLYDGGLPYVSSADGRRFRTQIELSHHLDALFKKKQIEKVMAATQERGWCVDQGVWCLDEKPQPVVNSGGSVLDPSGGPAAEEETTTFPADENRDHCVICGKVFKLIQENDELVYQNCREIRVLNDDAAATESDDQLVHVSCWKGLGEPPELTFDQTLQQ